MRFRVANLDFVSSRLLDVIDGDKMGTVNLQDVIGEVVTVPLMTECEA